MKKRVIAIGLTLAMLISSGTNVSYTEAKGKTALAKKAITLKKGKTFLLKLKNNTKKVKWSVNKKKIIKLSKKTKKSVTLKALKPGKAKVTAKVGKKKYTCKVTVSAKGKNRQSATPMPDNSQSVPQISQIPTTTKLPTETTVPGVQTTQTPDINNTATPDVKETQAPDVNNTATPDVKETQTPDVNNTATPDVKETQTPDADNTSTPDVKETEKPMESPAVTPEVPSTATPTSVPGETENPTGKTATIRGTVTDAEGTLLSNVKIYLVQSDDEGSYDTRFMATTDENGVYVVPEVEQGEKYRVLVEDFNSYEDGQRIWITAGEESTYDIKVQKSLIKVSGKLVDAEGKAVVNLTVSIYESSEERENGASPKEQFVSGEDGTYSVWLEKNKDYYLRVFGNGNEYFPENIQTNSANQDIQISESLVLVEGTVKDKAGTVYKNETVELNIKKTESDTQGYPRRLETNEDGKFCISMREGAVCNAELIIEGVSYDLIGTITVGNESTYDLLLDGEIETVNLNLVYANQKKVDEFYISGYMNRDGESIYINGISYGKRKGEDGTCRLRLKKGDLWHLEAEFHGRTSSLEDVLVGDESTYNKQLDISLKNVSGTVTTKNGMVVPEASLSFYDSSDMQSVSRWSLTDESGMYQVWLEEDVTYYVSTKICGETYEIGKVEDDYNLTLDANLEKVEIEVKGSDGEEYFTWSLYRNDSGKKGEYVCSGNRAKSLLLETGKKYYVQAATYIGSSDFFIAGSITVGDANTYKITVDEITSSGIVKSSNGTILTGANIVGSNVIVKFKNTIDNTEKSAVVRGEDGKYTIKLIKGQEYSVTVSVAGKTYEAGTIVADKDKEQDITIDAQLAAVRGKVTDANDEIIKAKKVCFYEDEACTTLAYEGVVSEDGTYGLYVEPGKTYYVRAAVPEGNYEYTSNYIYVPLGSITVTENGTYDLKSSKMCVSGKVTDADGNALSYCSLQYYASESDSDYDEIASERTDSNGQYTMWIEPGTYDVRVSVPYRGSWTKWYSVGLLDTSDAAAYDKTLQMHRIKGKITGVSKEVLAECRLYLYDSETAKDSEYIDEITPDEDGTYQTEIYVKDDTRYFLRFGDDDYVSVGSILSGDASTYDITVDKSFEKVSGKATFADGSLIKNGTLYLYDKESGYDQKRIASYSISDEGQFETGYLQTGMTYYCEFELDNVRYKSGSITVGTTDSYDQSIDKTLKRVSITVKEAGETVLDDISVTVKEDTEESKEICYGVTSEEGVFKTKYLEVGKTYVVSAKVCGERYETDPFTVGEEDQYEVKIDVSFVKAKGTVKKTDNSMVTFGGVYLYESSDDGNYDYKEYVSISNGEYSNLRLESGKTYYVRVDDYSQSGYQNAGVITGGDASTYDIKIQE